MKVKQFDKKTWDILQKINREISLTGASVIEWRRRLDKNEIFLPDKDEELSILELERRGAIVRRREDMRPPTLGPYAFVQQYNVLDPDPKTIPDGKILYLDIIQPRFNEVYKEYEINYHKDNKLKTNESANTLKSLDLVTNSLEPTDVIFLVFDKRFENPIRCEIKKRTGGVTYIKKLYDIAYIANAPGKRVDYDKNLADNINNGLFKIKEVARYMKTNKFNKPTLVEKSKDGILVLNNTSVVKTQLIKNIPTQHQYLYLDKTR